MDKLIRQHLYLLNCDCYILGNTYHSVFSGVSVGLEIPDSVILSLSSIGAITYLAHRSPSGLADWRLTQYGKDLWKQEQARREIRWKVRLAYRIKRIRSMSQIRKTLATAHGELLLTSEIEAWAARRLVGIKMRLLVDTWEKNKFFDPLRNREEKLLNFHMVNMGVDVPQETRNAIRSGIFPKIRRHELIARHYAVMMSFKRATPWKF